MIDRKITSFVQQIRADEGYSLKPYLDTNGWATVGTGHNLRVRSLDELPEDIRNGITAEMAGQLLMGDIEHSDHGLDTFMPWWETLPFYQKQVLRNQAFNMGAAKLLSFHTYLQFMKAREWKKAADDLAGTAWAHQVGERAERLRLQLVESRWV